MFKEAATAEKFAFAGNATVTLQYNKSGNWFTFKIVAPEKNPRGVRFVSLLTGPDRYTYLGTIDSDRVFKASPAQAPKPCAAFAFFLGALAKGEIPASLEVRHADRCGCCGRKITRPDSLEAGIGPECAEAMGVGRTVVRRAVERTCTTVTYSPLARVPVRFSASVPFIPVSEAVTPLRRALDGLGGGSLLKYRKTHISIAIKLA